MALVVSRSHKWCQTLSQDESDCGTWRRRCMFDVNSLWLDGLRLHFIRYGDLLSINLSWNWEFRG